MVESEFYVCTGGFIFQVLSIYFLIKVSIPKIIKIMKSKGGARSFFLINYEGATLYFFFKTRQSNVQPRLEVEVEREG